MYRHSCVFGSDFNCLYFAVIYSLSVCNVVKHSLYRLQKFVSCLKAAKLVVSSLFISKKIQTHLPNLLGHKIILVRIFPKYHLYISRYIWKTQNIHISLNNHFCGKCVDNSHYKSYFAMQ